MENSLFFNCAGGVSCTSHSKGMSPRENPATLREKASAQNHITLFAMQNKFQR
jgi:hypothetical protein